VPLPDIPESRPSLDGRMQATSNDDAGDKTGHCGGWACENTSFRAAPDGSY